MFRPATLHTSLADIYDEPHHTEALLSEEKVHADVDVEKFVTSLNVKTAFQKIGLAAATCNFLLYPVMFANFMRIFWLVQDQLQGELDNNLYYRCEILPNIRTAISYDGATLRAEGAGLTTTSAAIGALVALVAAQYQLARYFIRRHQLSDAKKLNDGVNRFIKSLMLQNTEHETKIRAYLLDTPIEKLTLLLSADRAKKGFDENIAAEIKNLGSAWEKFADDLAWYRGEVNDSYLMPIIGISTIPAFIITFIAAYELNKESSCQTFPLVSYLSDSCDVSEQYKNLSLLTYFWDVLSATGLSVYCSVLLARFVTAFSPLHYLRQWFYENVHQPYFQYNPDKWVYRKLTWRISSYIFTPVILTYSFIEAFKLANNYLAGMEGMNCPSMDSLLWSIYSGNHVYDPSCPTSEKSMAIGGFLGDFEIVKVDFMLFTLTCLCYLGAALVEKYFIRDISDLSDDEKLERAVSLKFAKQLLEKLEKIGSLSWDFAIFACVITGVLQFFPIKRFADDILHHDLEVYDSYNSTFFSNHSAADNQTEMLTKICPFDNLTQIYLDQNLNFTNFNLSKFINANLPIKIINNMTSALIIAPACPHREMAAVYAHNIVGIDSGCDPLLETRSIGGFVGPYWLGISFVSGGVYILATGSQLFSWGVSAFKKCLRQYREQETEEDGRDFEDSNHPYQPLAVHETNHKHSSYRGNIFNRTLTDEIKCKAATESPQFRQTI
jgi:hypothetical protein